MPPIAFHIMRLLVMVLVLFVWLKTVAGADERLHLLGIAIAFVSGHLFAFATRRWLRKQRS